MISAELVEGLRAAVVGNVLLPGSDTYESARTIWNALIDKHPAVIVQCANTQDVVAAVNFARDNGLVLSVRSGGHNIAGTALCDDGVVVDLSQMKAVSVNPSAKTAQVQAGATLHDFDAAAQEHGLATPLGINSTTGVAGLTLGGGFGWLSRKHGMTIDNLAGVEVVTANGDVLNASENEHPSLFWALRGGSGNFGIVTRFDFRLHSFGPNALSGLIVYPFSDAKSVFQKWRDYVASAPNELTVWSVSRLAPPLPFLPDSVHGTPILALAFLYSGDDEVKGLELIEPLRHFGSPLGEAFGVQPYVAWQQAFDPLLTPGSRNYWKSHNFTTLADGLFDEVIKAINVLPDDQCEIFFGGIGGATALPSPTSTAYSHRDTMYAMNVHGRWEDKGADEKCITWARNFHKASAPFASGGVYVNFLTADESDRVAAAYGVNYERLSRVKQEYDPKNLFRSNQNILPAEA